jgi:hypothetical protein
MFGVLAGWLHPVALSHLFLKYLTRRAGAQGYKKLVRTTALPVGRASFNVAHDERELSESSTKQSITSGLVNLLAPTVFCAIDSQNTQVPEGRLFCIVLATFGACSIKT